MLPRTAAPLAPMPILLPWISVRRWRLRMPLRVIAVVRLPAEHVRRADPRAADRRIGSPRRLDAVAAVAAAAVPVASVPMKLPGRGLGLVPRRRCRRRPLPEMTLRAAARGAADGVAGGLLVGRYASPVAQGRRSCDALSADEVALTRRCPLVPMSVAGCRRCVPASCRRSSCRSDRLIRDVVAQAQRAGGVGADEVALDDVAVRRRRNH